MAYNAKSDTNGVMTAKSVSVTQGTQFATITITSDDGDQKTVVLAPDHAVALAVAILNAAYFTRANGGVTDNLTGYADTHRAVNMILWTQPEPVIKPNTPAPAVELGPDTIRALTEGIENAIANAAIWVRNH